MIDPLYTNAYDSGAEGSELGFRIYTFHPSFKGAHGAEGDYYGVSEQVHLIIEPHAQHNLLGWSVNTGSAWFRHNLTGYLESLQ